MSAKIYSDAKPAGKPGDNPIPTTPVKASGMAQDNCREFTGPLPDMEGLAVDGDGDLVRWRAELRCVLDCASWSR